MRRTACLLACAVASAASAQSPGATPPKPLTMQAILDASTASDWRRPDPANTLVMQLPTGRVVIELAPQFAPAHVANIRAMAGNGYWSGTSINRSQDNFVVQWGDPAEDPAPRKPLGDGVKATLPAEFERSAQGLAFNAMPDRDGWAAQVGFSAGFPAGRASAGGQAWLAHCYGMVGAGRDTAADSSTGSELYVVTGQSPRQLDRNITTVGRVVQGMELLSVLPRGTGPLGFYERAAQRLPITSITLASALPAEQRPMIELLRTDTPTFDALVEARRNRKDDFYKRPAGHIDVCNVPLPVRDVTSAATPDNTATR